jgi:hypothetical protein
MAILQASRPIGVGIIVLSAAGGWAATAHLPALRALQDDFSIAAIPEGDVRARPANSPYCDTVAHARLAPLGDIRSGREAVPRFAHAARFHQLLGRLQA